MSMKWTTERPAEPGYYWLADDAFAKIVRVRLVEAGTYAGQTQDILQACEGDQAVGDVDQIEGKWAGPIEEPHD